MAFHDSLWFFFLITFLSSTQASNTLQVGGKDGWTLHPSESYDRWAGRLRFLINDTLHFKYNGGLDSVLVVNKDDYDNCKVDNPISKLDGGDSSFQFDRSGQFYFITGNKSNCDQGQKLNIVVLALRNRPPPPHAAATPPSPAAPSPSPTAPSPSPTAPSPSPAAATPPSPSAPSPSPTAATPSSPSSSPSAAIPPSPSPSPAAVNPALPPSTTPSSTTPTTSPSGGGGGSGESPGSGNPADVNSPPPPTGSTARPALSGGTTATVIFALWWFY